jgi:hypothetical protein
MSVSIIYRALCPWDMHKKPSPHYQVDLTGTAEKVHLSGLPDT